MASLGTHQTVKENDCVVIEPMVACIVDKRATGLRRESSHPPTCDTVWLWLLPIVAGDRHVPSTVWERHLRNAEAVSSWEQVSWLCGCAAPVRLGQPVNLQRVVKPTW